MNKSCTTNKDAQYTTIGINDPLVPSALLACEGDDNDGDDDDDFDCYPKVALLSLKYAPNNC